MMLSWNGMFFEYIKLLRLSSKHLAHFLDRIGKTLPLTDWVNPITWSDSDPVIGLFDLGFFSRYPEVVFTFANVLWQGYWQGEYG